MENYITIKLNGGSEYIEDCYITPREAELLRCQGNKAHQQATLNHVLQFINWREQMNITEDTFKIISYTVKGITRGFIE